MMIQICIICYFLSRFSKLEFAVICVKTFRCRCFAFADILQ